MDVQMPGMSGVEATAALCSAWATARVIFLTPFDRDDYVFQAIRAGALGYLLKDTTAEELMRNIWRIHAGETFIQPEIASRTLRELLRPQQALLEPLSEREREVLILLAQGASNKDIAAPGSQRGNSKEPHFKHPGQVAGRKQDPRSGDRPAI